MPDIKNKRADPKTKTAAKKKTAVKNAASAKKNVPAVVKPPSKIGAKSKDVNLLENLDNIKEWAAQGLTHEQIAAKLGVSRSTFFVHKANHEEIAHALSSGRILFRERLLPQLENAAVKRMLGYETIEEKVVKDKDGNIIQTEVRTKQVAPSDTMLIFGLQNLLGHVYKDRRNFELTGAEGKDLPAMQQVIILPDNGRNHNDNET